MSIKWQKAPVKTVWGDDMVVASVEIDNDHMVDLYCERSQIAKVEAMLLQAEQAQPVACTYCHNSHTLGAVYFDQNCAGCVKRMATPPQRQWVGLTDEEIDEWTPEIHAVIRFIEAKLKEKNT